MRPNPEEEASRWIKQANNDLEAARDLQKTGQYNLTCFLAQQAAEKAVKALQYSQGVCYVQCQVEPIGLNILNPNHSAIRGPTRLVVHM